MSIDYKAQRASDLRSAFYHPELLSLLDQTIEQTLKNSREHGFCADYFPSSEDSGPFEISFTELIEGCKEKVAVPYGDTLTFHSHTGENYAGNPIKALISNITSVGGGYDVSKGDLDFLIKNFQRYLSCFEYGVIDEGEVKGQVLPILIRIYPQQGMGASLHMYQLTGKTDVDLSHKRMGDGCRAEFDKLKKQGLIVEAIVEYYSDSKEYSTIDAAIDLFASSEISEELIVIKSMDEIEKAMMKKPGFLE
ncbi:MAG: hypothetical protein ABIC04_03255 [Nanoarchaeota archaeon]